MVRLVTSESVNLEKPQKLNYAPLLRGLKDHVIDGRMNAEEFTIFVWLVLTANPFTGVVYTNAKIIAGQMNKNAASVKRALKSLTKARHGVPDGYIYYDGNRGFGGGAYPILVLKYPRAKTGSRTTMKDYPQEAR